MFSGNLNFDEHVTYVLSICSQRLYLIKLLRSQGMPENKVHIIFVALIISRISYALSAWGGFLNSQQLHRIDAFLRIHIALVAMIIKQSFVCSLRPGVQPTLDPSAETF